MHSLHRHLLTFMLPSQLDPRVSKDFFQGLGGNSGYFQIVIKRILPRQANSVAILFCQRNTNTKTLFFIQKNNRKYQISTLGD